MKNFVADCGMNENFGPVGFCKSLLRSSGRLCCSLKMGTDFILLTSYCFFWTSSTKCIFWVLICFQNTPYLEYVKTPGTCKIGGIGNESYNDGRFMFSCLLSSSEHEGGWLLVNWPRVKMIIVIWAYGSNLMARFRQDNKFQIGEVSFRRLNLVAWESNLRWR